MMEALFFHIKKAGKTLVVSLLLNCFYSLITALLYLKLFYDFINCHLFSPITRVKTR